MPRWTIEPLNSSQEREPFSCGKELLDKFLKTLVSQYEKRRLGRTFVATNPGDKRVLGYYTIAAGSFALSCLPESARKKLPKHPVPTIHLGRLAVDLTCQGQGLGKDLLFHFLARAMTLSEELGVFAVDVWAMDNESLAWFRAG